jgi:hypothetical protein
MFSARRLTSVSIALFAIAATACSNNDSTGPATPDPVLGLSATATGSSTARITFSGRSGESYEIQRAEGATGTFAVITTIPTLSADGTQTYNDTGLKVTTLYRYMVITVKGTARSGPTAEATTTTLAFGNASANITGDITSSRTLYADTTYSLVGFIHVANGATLTIQPGTKIQGDFNTVGSCLMILRGAKIQAIGTADAPIVFTSSRPVGQRQIGDWGGLILVGNAPSNRSGNVIIEGSGTDGTAVVSGKNYEVTYSGGTVATDNSGTLQYVIVQFAGYAPSLNNEFNSFTFAAVGSGTRVSYTESLAGLDDAYEFFGGGFDIDHIVAYETGDDMFDMSEGWVGRMQFLIGFNSVQLTPRTGAGFLATDLEGIENDGCNGSGCDNGFNQQPYTIPVVANFTMVGCGNANCVGAAGGHGLMLRRGTGGYYINGVVARFPTDGVSLRDNESYARGGSVPIPDLTTSDLAVKNIVFTETPLVFQTGTAQNALDLTGNSLTLSATPATSLFMAIPATGTAPTGVSAFDWTPVAGSPIASGGLTTFTGKLAAKAGTFVTGTSYLGAAAPGGTKWWAGWTLYARN